MDVFQKRMVSTTSAIVIPDSVLPMVGYVQPCFDPEQVDLPVYNSCHALWEKNSVLEYSNMLNSSKYNYLAIWHIKRFTTSTLERWLTIFLVQHI